MPPTVRFTRESVLEAACRLVHRDGPAALNARAVARELGGSTQPIFRLFSGMEELNDAVLQHVSEAFFADMNRKVAASDRPYLAMGLHYVRYALENPELFKLLFMRDRLSNGDYKREMEAYEELYRLLAEHMQITRDQAAAFYARTWVYIHGLAVAIATQYIPCMGEDEMVALLTEACQAAAHQMGLHLSA